MTRRSLETIDIVQQYHKDKILIRERLSAQLTLNANQTRVLFFDYDAKRIQHLDVLKALDPPRKGTEAEDKAKVQ